MRKLSVYRQQAGFSVMVNMPASGLNPAGNVTQDVRMDFAEPLVDLNVPVVPIRREADQLVGAQETAEPALVRAAGWQARGFVYNNPGQKPVSLKSIPQPVQHFLI